jgi:hypothetical protein
MRSLISSIILSHHCNCRLISYVKSPSLISASPTWVVGGPNLSVIHYGSYLKQIIKGLRPILPGKKRKPATTSPTWWNQCVPSQASYNFLKPDFIIPIYLSTIPFDRGWYVLITLCTMPSLSKYKENAPANSFPLSDRTQHGTPYLHVTFVWNHSVMVWLFKSGSTPTSSHREKTSTTTTTCYSPPGPRGFIRGIQSMHHVWKGHISFKVGIR